MPVMPLRRIWLTRSISSSGHPFRVARTLDVQVAVQHALRVDLAVA